jgi:hypothetical protein
MNIEDLVILSVRNSIPLNSWDTRLVYSIYEQIIIKNSLTEKQGAAMVKILKRYHSAISAHAGRDISQFLENPSYRLGIRKINTVKRITVVDHDYYGKAIQVEFPFDQKIIEDIKSKKTINHLGQWDSEKKSWIFPLSEYSIAHLKNIAQENFFEMDEEFTSYAEQYNSIVENMEQYIPILVAENDGVKIRNFSQNSPIFPPENILKSVFEARKLGVLTWCENIEEYLETEEINQNTRDFVRSNPSEDFHINSEKYDIFSLTDIVKYMTPTLFIIPGGSELEKLQTCCEFLKNIGIDSAEVSVMFRLPKETHENFNNFVKNSGFNNPITDTTRAVFVSGKFPKPVLKSGIKFHTVVNLGFDNVHYSLRDFVKNHENLVYYTEKINPKQTEFTWLLAK